jgi:hypothetical protein
LSNYEYSNIDIYHEYKNGISISEIVDKTGIKRKTWNKRFERLEKKNKVATINNKNNNYSDLIIQEKDGNIDGDNSVIINNENGDIGDNRAENVATTNTFDSKGDAKAIGKDKNDGANMFALLFIVLLIIGLILLFKWIYENYDKWKLTKNQE